MVSVRISEGEAEVLDRIRGSATRANWLRAQIRDAEGDLPPTIVEQTLEVLGPVPTGYDPGT